MFIVNTKRAGCHDRTAVGWQSKGCRSFSIKNICVHVSGMTNSCYPTLFTIKVILHIFLCKINSEINQIHLYACILQRLLFKVTYSALCIMFYQLQDSLTIDTSTYFKIDQPISSLCIIIFTTVFWLYSSTDDTLSVSEWLAQLIFQTAYLQTMRLGRRHTKTAHGGLQRSCGSVREIWQMRKTLSLFFSQPLNPSLHLPAG